MIVRPLKGFNAFTAALRTGRRFTEGPLALSIITAERNVAAGTLHLGVSVGKRTAPHAVVRTRIRRLLREAVRTYATANTEALTEAGITTMTLTWRTAPSHPSLIRLTDVEPVVHAALDRITAALRNGVGQ